MKHAHLIVPRTLVAGSASGELLYAPTGLSFWGGVDPRSAEVIDRHHPLSGRHLHGRLLAIPGGRGSCTGSSVLLELILGGRAPAAILLREPDEILALGAIVAEELFGRSLPIACLGERFDELAAYPWARLADGRLELHRDAPPPLEARPAEALATDAGPRLDAFDQALLAGEHGEAARLAMRIVLRMAALQGAQRLVEIQRAHIDACIYTGPAGLRFAETLRDLGARVRVPTTLNAISVDQRRWREQGVPATLGEPAAALAQAYLDMGAQPSFTCAPYLLDDSARAGEQIVWAESNAVLFANSVLGARTNKYADFMDICCALTGRAPLAGCHLDEQRQARVLIEVEDLGSVDDAFYPTLGYLCGLLCDGQIPAIDGLRQRQPDHDALKAFGAALGTSSSVPMFHVIGVTPEAPDLASAFGGRAPRRTLRVGRERLRDAWRELDSADETRIDLVALGNPHFSASEFAQLAALCHGRRRHPEVALVITSSRQVVAQAEAAGHLATLQAFGARLVTDTCWCMLDEPLVPPGARTLMTNSAKYAHYAPRTGQPPGALRRPRRLRRGRRRRTGPRRAARLAERGLLMFDYTFHWRSAFNALPEMLAGSLVTLQVTALSMLFGILIALLLAFARLGGNRPLRAAAGAWISIARNTPALFQIYILYFGLGSFGLHVSSWFALLAGVTFNNAGYLAETFRGGLQAVPETQLRAARSLGMSAPQAYRLVVIPQLLRVVFYPLTNQLVWAMLMTSLGVVVGLTDDLTGVTQALNVKTFRTFEYFALAAVLYFAMAKLLVLAARLLGWRLFRY